jgi:hypothetical protein
LLSVAATAVGMWATLFALSKRSGMSIAVLPALHTAIGVL